MKKLIRILFLALAVATITQNIAVASMDPGGDPPPCNPLDPTCLPQA